ncbi:cobalt-precorrin-6A reductase [Couchioplanes caeruleus]|uniref:cobalt-precorrin-6A reductase n=1 Tax=Couchioplanes caeruleus TaxID=56438 RepID=UPI00201C3AA1|nr:cobalt-precorrin-6A reductase [Couchioplanes caeruleus]UQU66554.1 cobalt-precorrin-6A reductase [Couchioplanes caeruleus]
MPQLRVLVLGGTTEGRALAGRVPVISSLAGRTSRPLLPPGEVRTGGFGGVDGLEAYLRAQRIDAVVDATHPFAATMTGHAAAATSRAGIPLLILRRPGWTERPGDRWHRVPDLDAAAALLPTLRPSDPGADVADLDAAAAMLPTLRPGDPGAGVADTAGGGMCVFLTTGRQSIAAFAASDDLRFVSRSVEPPVPPVPRHLEVVLDRGPFDLDAERDLLLRHRIDVLVTKDSGGAAAKLDAARELGIPVVMVDRPPLPAGVPTVATVDAVVEWLSALEATHAR